MATVMLGEVIESAARARPEVPSARHEVDAAVQLPGREKAVAAAAVRVEVRLEASDVVETKRVRALGPPQVWRLLPEQVIEQVAVFVRLAPFSRTEPQ
jgi:hypothetical protein